MNKIHHTARLCVPLTLLLPVLSLAQGQTAADLIEMDFEQLVNMEIEVESAGKNKAKGLDVPYAAYVISAEDIRLSGVRNIPEALRMAPGVSVDHVGANEWSVAIRGAGGQFSRFVLVLVNGKSLYTSVFSGVNWDEVNYNLADIKQIEVIRGPNAAAWGANAVNGIINIITYAADEKPGGSTQVWVGEHHKEGGSLRHSGELSGDWSYSVSGLYSVTEGLDNPEANLQELDGRDWRLSSQLQRTTNTSKLQFYADVFGSEIGPIWSNIYMNPVRKERVVKLEEKLGFSLQANYESTINEDWEWKLRSSVDSTERDSNFYFWNSSSVQADVELHGSLGNHTLNIGVNSRLVDSEIELSLRDESEYYFHFVDDNETFLSYGAYISDTIRLSDRWQASVSARLDDNELSGSNLQPSLRLMWQPTVNQRVWVASSRAASTPSRALVDTRESPYEIIPANAMGNPLPIVIVISNLIGDKNIVTDAVELGYRFAWDKNYIDFAYFQNDYTGQIKVTPVGEPELYPALPNYPIALIQHSVFDGSDTFDARGYEMNLGLKILNGWDVQTSYSKLDIKNNLGWENMLSIRTNHSLSKKWHLSAWFMHRSDFENLFGEIENISTADLVLNYSHNSNTTISLQFKNIGSTEIQAKREAFGVDGLYFGPHGLLTLTHMY